MKSDDLIQQTRSANATEVSAGFAYEVTRLTLVGLIIGLFTTVAAGFAAYYARRAYLEAMKARVHQEWASQLELQPFIYWKACDCEIIDLGVDKKMVRVDIKIYNTGATPALNVMWKLGITLRTLGAKTPPPDTFNSGPTIIPPRDYRTIFNHIIVSTADWEGVVDCHKEIAVLLDITFDSRFAKGKRIRDARFSFGDDVEKGEFYLEHLPSDEPTIPDLLPDESAEQDSGD